MSVVDDATATMIANFPAKTGRPLDEWVALVRAGGPAKHGEIVTMLKAEYGMTHGFANFVANRALAPDDAPSGDDLVDAMYAGPKASPAPAPRRRDRRGPGVRERRRAGAEEGLRQPPPQEAVRNRRAGARRAPRDRPEPGRGRAGGTPRAGDRDVQPPRPDRLARRARRGARRLAPAGLRRSVTRGAQALG